MGEYSGTDAANKRPMIYEDFKLRFSGYSETEGVGTYKVWVEGQAPGGSMLPDAAVTRTYDPKAFWDEPATRTSGLAGRLENRKRLTRDDLLKLGGLLADLALPEGEVRGLFEKSLAKLEAGQGLRLRLLLDAPSLAQLPWEYMALPQASGEARANDFLALRREISIVRTDTVQAVPRAFPDRSVARVVGLLSSPDDQDQDPIDVDKDQVAINKAIAGINEQAKTTAIEVKWAARPTTRQALIDALADGADLFHFAGHGAFSPVNNEGQIILETEDYKSDYYKGEQLASLLRNAGVRLAVLGACDSGRRDGENVWSGVAPGLTREQVPAVIGNQFHIKSDNAALMAATIYPRVLSGYSMDEALFEARQAIYAGSGLEQRDWGVPVLYMRSEDGVLFPQPQPGQALPGSSGNPFVSVALRLKEVAGTATGLEAGEIKSGTTEVTATADTVKEGGNLTVVKVDSIGG